MAEREGSAGDDRTSGRGQARALFLVETAEVVMISISVLVTRGVSRREKEEKQEPKNPRGIARPKRIQLIQTVAASSGEETRRDMQEVPVEVEVVCSGNPFSVPFFPPFVAVEWSEDS